MAVPHAQFGDYTFADNNCLITSWQDDNQIREAVAPVPRSDIAKAQAGFLAPRSIKVEGLIVASDLVPLQERIDAFLAAHGPGFRNLYRTVERYLVAEARTVSVSEDNMNPTSAKVSVTYQAANPFWQTA